MFDPSESRMGLCNWSCSSACDGLVGLVVWHPPWERQTWVWFLLLLWIFLINKSNLIILIIIIIIIFFLVKSASGWQTGTPVTTLPGSWHYRVSAGTGWPCVNILWLGEVQIWSATSVSVWQHIQLLEQIGLWDTVGCCWGVKQPENNYNIVYQAILHFFCVISVCHDGGFVHVDGCYNAWQVFFFLVW